MAYGDLVPGSYAGYGYNQPSTTGGLFDYFQGDDFAKMGESFGSFGQGLGGVASLAGGLYSMYQGNQMLGMYEDQLDIQKEKWAETKTELAHNKQTRANASNAYFS